MAWLLFLDESGHDHRNTPYEVYGGFTIELSRTWPFISAIKDCQNDCFGFQLSEYGIEIKGESLLSKKRLKHAAQIDDLDDQSRKMAAMDFIQKTKSN